MNKSEISSRTEGGVYIIIFYIPVKKTIEVGRAKIICTFSRGWYAYVGSAHGSGGLRARTSRHTRFLGDGKKVGWHFDSIREIATVKEIWCAEVPKEAECRWSQTLSRLSDVSAPIPGIGSTDCNCPAHVYRFRRQLPASLMRSFARVDADKFVSIEVEPQKRIATTKLEWEQDYWKGRRILERLRHMYWHRGEPCPAKLWVKKDNPVLEELTAGTPYKQLKKQLELAYAVDSLIQRHGEPAYRIIFDLAKPQKRKDILEISRKSCERQDERVTEVWAWDERSIGPQRGDTAPDTMDFAKILTRIGRAKGPLRVACEVLKPQLGGLNEAARSSIIESLAAYQPQIKELSRQIRDMETVDVVRTKYRPSKPANKLKLDLLHRQVAGGLGCLKKTNRDIPRSSYDLRPTPEQKARALVQLKLTQELADFVLANVG